MAHFRSWRREPSQMRSVRYLRIPDSSCGPTLKRYSISEKELGSLGSTFLLELSPKIRYNEWCSLVQYSDSEHICLNLFLMPQSPRQNQADLGQVASQSQISFRVYGRFRERVGSWLWFCLLEFIAQQNNQRINHRRIFSYANSPGVLKGVT